MAPQAAATTATAPAATTTASTATATPATTDTDNGGLSQAQLGGILGGVVGLVVVVLLVWYWLTHTDGYAVYRDQRRHRQRTLRARQRYYRQEWRRPRRRSFYETEVTFSSSSEVSEMNSRHLARLQQMEHLARMEAAMQEEAERQRRAASVATSGPYILNPPPVRFPPTARRANYRQTAWPQIRGVRRTP
ncbi:hypothetical protein SEUCBS139899_002985 [Sporothrix eucalyptigena]